MPDTLTAFALTCSLRRSGQGKPGSTDKLVADLFGRLEKLGVRCDSAHVADHDVKPGVTSDEGEGDAWPALRSRIMEADIFVLGTPIWQGQSSSMARRVLERMDAFLSEADDRGRMPGLGKVALVCVVGNEDGAHACHATSFQALSDIGFTIPGNAGLYWVGEAMGSTDYADLEEVPEVIGSTLDLAASNAVHLARALSSQPFPGTD